MIVYPNQVKKSDRTNRPSLKVWLIYAQQLGAMVDKELSEAWRNLQSDQESEFLVQKYLNLLKRKRDRWSQKPSLMFVGDGDFSIRKSGEENSKSENVDIDGKIFFLCDSIRKDYNRIYIVVDEREYGPILLVGDYDSEREWINCYYEEKTSKNKLSELNFVLFVYEWDSMFTSSDKEGDFLSSLSSGTNFSFNNREFYFLSSSQENKAFEVSSAFFSSPFEEEVRGFELFDIKEGYSILKDMVENMAEDIEEDISIDKIWRLL